MILFLIVQRVKMKVCVVFQVVSQENSSVLKVDVSLFLGSVMERLTVAVVRMKLLAPALAQIKKCYAKKESVFQTGSGAMEYLIVGEEKTRKVEIKECRKTLFTLLVQVNCTCQSDEWRCQIGGGCVGLDKICDGTLDCTDRSDEWNCLSLENSTLKIRLLDRYFMLV